MLGWELKKVSSGVFTPLAAFWRTTTDALCEYQPAIPLFASARSRIYLYAPPGQVTAALPRERRVLPRGWRAADIEPF